MYNTKGAEIFVVDGVKFHLDKNTGYYGGYINNGCRKIRLHRYIWEKFHGEIPKGYHVHHIDKNKNNNDIENLILLSPKEHGSLHCNSRTENEKQMHKDNLERYARPKACEWHGSKSGIEWHKKHGIETAKKLKNTRIEKTCKCCGKTFFDNGFNKANFCGNNCKSKWRRQQGLDNIKAICVICGKEYEMNKYKPSKTCSFHCGNVLRHKRLHGIQV